MRNLYKTLCAVLAAALLALTLLPAGVLAAGADLEISAQNFPDANFRAWLTNPANLNGAGADGSLSAEELAAVTKLDLSGQNIADLTGIEHFTALESLNVSNNRLTKLDVRANTRLRYLYCATNFLTSLDVTRCAELIDLNCERNQLTTLDLSGNPKLQQLYCRHNFLSALDVSHNLELVFIETFDNQLTQFDASMLKKLRFLHIDYNRLTELDMSHNPVLEGNGFVAANNSLNRLTLPNIPDFPVEAEVFLEQNPRTGYDRTEWYYDQGYTRPIGEKDVIMATGQTVYARWVPNPYTVYYRANGGTGSMADQAVVYDQEFALTPNAFSRTGYTFDTWHTYADGIGGASYTNGQTVRNLAGGNGSRDAVYLYAQWKANAYTIQYNGNGGSGDTQATAAVYDTPANLAENGFSNSEGVFLGWARDPQAKQPEFFAGQPVKNLTADPNGTVTLYAVWMSNAEIQQGYKEQVAALQARYTEADYYTEDWAALTGAADTARSAIEGAGSVQETMQQALTTRAALAREKAEAVQQLNAVYDELTGWQYTPENAALLAQKKQSALDEIEAADSTGLPAALFTAGKAALEQVDPIPKTVTVTSWPAASLVRGQALSQASLSGGKADVPGRFVWKEPDTRPQAGGSYPVVFVPADSRRYTSVEGQAALTVNEPAPAPTAA
ncbi:InlB B-repeat-containing protein, partial [Gemmiger formicilis]|uniref:InlB B-repeat-containing protein n=1 Tax=Gemmiger formicilis TaxID=745368 RepID=UPI0019582D85